MRVLVCGGRTYDDYGAVSRALDAIYATAPHDTMMVIQGGASGADKLARDWCMERFVSYANYGADWKRHGPSAGPRRNQRMLSDGKPDVVLAFPGGRGTADMVDRASKAGVTVRIYK